MKEFLETHSVTRKRKTMKIALFYVFSYAIVASSRAQACGREVLAYDFDDHPGEYSKWTMSDMERAWPKLEPRPDFRGDMQKPGLVYSEGIERASVGKQNLRLFMPKVIILDLAIYLRYFAILDFAMFLSLICPRSSECLCYRVLLRDVRSYTLQVLQKKSATLQAVSKYRC